MSLDDRSVLYRAVDEQHVRMHVLADISRERDSQFEKWGDQHWPDGTSAHFEAQANFYKYINETHVKSDLLRVTWTSIFLEEAFEAISEADIYKLRAELIQVAAVATAWVEDIDNRS